MERVEDDNVHVHYTPTGAVAGSTTLLRVYTAFNLVVRTGG